MAKSLAITACRDNEENVALNNQTCQRRNSMAPDRHQAHISQIYFKPCMQTKNPSTNENKNPEPKQKKLNSKQTKSINTRDLTGCLRLLFSFPIQLNKTRLHWLLVMYFQQMYFSLESSSLSKSSMHYNMHSLLFDEENIKGTAIMILCNCVVLGKEIFEFFIF